MSNYQSEGWPLDPTSTVYMDGTGLYHIHKYDEPGIITSVRMPLSAGEAIRTVVGKGLVDVRNNTVADVLCVLNNELKANYSDQISEKERVALVTSTLEHVISLFSPPKDSGC